MPLPSLDQIHRFTFDNLPLRGHWVRLHNVLDDAFAHQDYSIDLKKLLAEQFASVAMIADGLKFDGAVSLQARSAGPIKQSLAEIREQKYLRGIAQLDEANQTPDQTDHLSSWFSKPATLALSLIPKVDPQNNTYQGLIDLHHTNLPAALQSYFADSEQLPTHIFLAHDLSDHSLTTTGMLLQRLPDHSESNEIQTAQHEEGWRSASILAETVEAQELATLAPTQLLHRLFNEFACRLHPARSLSYRCTCNRQKTSNALRLLAPEELDELLIEQGTIKVGCELCGVFYDYDKIDIATLSSPTESSDTQPPLH